MTIKELMELNESKQEENIEIYDWKNNIGECIYSGEYKDIPLCYDLLQIIRWRLYDYCEVPFICFTVINEPNWNKPIPKLPCIYLENRKYCLCRKCVGQCYVNNCDKKVIKGGMCRSGIVTECDLFEEKEK